MHGPLEALRIPAGAGRAGRLLAAAVVAAAAGCGAVEQPTPSRELEFAFQPLVDIGLFTGPPDIPDPWSITELPDGTSVVVVDRDTMQQVRRVEYDGERWSSLGGFDAPLLPAGDDGPLLRRVTVGPEHGFDAETVLLLGRVPNGPINYLEASVDGELVALQPMNRPLTVFAFAGGTVIDDTVTPLDAGSHRFDVLEVHDVDPPVDD